MAVASPACGRAGRESVVKQTKLKIDLETKRTVRLELGIDQIRELVLLMAQAIAAVHRARRDGEHEDAREEDGDVNDE